MGIIAILVALLFPVFARVRAAANQTKCAGNLRSLGQALIMYTQHYGYYPGAIALGSEPAAGWGFPVWTVRLRAFTGGDQEVFYCPSEDERCRWVKGRPPPVPGAPTVAAIPAIQFHAGFGYAIEEWVPNDEVTPFSYGYNHFGAQQDNRLNRGLGSLVNFSIADPTQCEVKAARVRAASDMIAIADTVADGRDDFVINPNFPEQHLAAVHGGGANVLFCDGHVQWHRQEDLVLHPPLSTAAEAQRWVQIARRWNNDNTGPGGD